MLWAFRDLLAEFFTYMILCYMVPSQQQFACKTPVGLPAQPTVIPENVCLLADKLSLVWKVSS